jgi:hypothetical protein
MKNVLIGLAGLLAAVFSAGVNAAETDSTDGGKQMYILFDRGITDQMSQLEVSRHNAVGQWMEKDLVNVFKRYAREGYRAQLIGDSKDFKRGAGHYLLAVKITEYNAGNKAARIMLGFGAGGMTLKTHYELCERPGKPLLAKDESVFSGRDWRNLARKMNEMIAQAVTDAIRAAAAGKE